jgi:hypothetical protein
LLYLASKSSGTMGACVKPTALALLPHARVPAIPGVVPTSCAGDTNDTECENADNERTVGIQTQLVRTPHPASAGEDTGCGP